MNRERVPAKKAAPAPAAGKSNVALDWFRSIVIGFLIFIVIRTFILQTYTVVSESMEDTLLVGDFLVVNKTAYGARIPGTDAALPGYTDPSVGDVVVFRGHHEPIDLIKRIVGGPGDTLEMRETVLYRNGEPQLEPYARNDNPAGDGYHPDMEWQRAFRITPADASPAGATPAGSRSTYSPTRDSWGPIAVPAGHYFVLGDNRHSSLDGRFWGFIAAPQIKGRAAFLYFSWDSHAYSSVPVLGNIRWPRIGNPIR